MVFLIWMWSVNGVSDLDVISEWCFWFGCDQWMVFLIWMWSVNGVSDLDVISEWCFWFGCDQWMVFLIWMWSVNGFFWFGCDPWMVFLIWMRSVNGVSDLNAVRELSVLNELNVSCRTEVFFLTCFLFDKIIFVSFNVPNKNGMMSLFFDVTGLMTSVLVLVPCVFRRVPSVQQRVVVPVPLGRSRAEAIVSADWLLGIRPVHHVEVTHLVILCGSARKYVIGVNPNQICSVVPCNLYNVGSRKVLKFPWTKILVSKGPTDELPQDN